MYKILIVGIGNLGSRYLQGMVKCNERLSINAIDTNDDALLRAKILWTNLGNEQTSKHEIFFSKHEPTIRFRL